jgi:alpha-soluble NSF attachment protein
MANELVKRAEQRLTKSCGLMGFLGGGPKYEEAAELFQQAANQYKLSKDWEEAANCFEQCAFCAHEAGSAFEEANHLKEAGNILVKVSSARAVEQYEKAIGIYSAAGRFQECGKLLMSIAELYEGERLQHTEVKDYYKRAAEMFELDDHGKSNFTKCNLKVAEYAAKDGELQEAIRIFETEGEKALQNNLLQYSAKDKFLNAGILHLCSGDSVTVNLALEKYRSLDPRFEGSREGELLASLAESLENQDVDAFTDKLGDYDSITRLDPWKTAMLMKVKDLVQGDSTNAVDAVDLT